MRHAGAVREMQNLVRLSATRANSRSRLWYSVPSGMLAACSRAIPPSEPNIRCTTLRRIRVRHRRRPWMAGNCGTRVHSLDRVHADWTTHLSKGHERGAQKRQAVRPKVLMTVLSKYRVDITGNGRLCSCPKGRPQGDDAAEDQGGDAVAVGDVHQVHNCEGTVTKARSLKKSCSKECNGRLGANLVRVLGMSSGSVHAASACL